MDTIAPDLENDLYERDFAAWAAAQARLLRARDWAAADWPNIIEEIESLGRAEKHALRSHIATIIEHMLKLDHGRQRDPERKWMQTVRMQRIKVRKNLNDNPSLRPLVPSLITEEYGDARDMALLSFERFEPDALPGYRAAIPRACPYTIADILPD